MSGKQFTRLQQYQWCRAAIDALCLLDSLGIAFNQKALLWCRARVRNLKAAMRNTELENRTVKKSDKLFKEMKKAAESLIPGANQEPVGLEDVQNAMVFATVFAQMMIQDAVNTCPLFANAPVWHEVKRWIYDASELVESPAEAEQLKPEEVLACKVYHSMCCQILGYPKKYGYGEWFY